MAVWPTTLPQSPLVNSYSRTQESQVVRTPMETGPAKQRRRYTKPLENMNVELIMDKDQLSTFVDFHDNTLGGGADKFEWKHPVTGDTQNFRIVQESEPFTIEPIHQDLFRVSFKMETV